MYALTRETAKQVLDHAPVDLPITARDRISVGRDEGGIRCTRHSLPRTLALRLLPHVSSKSSPYQGGLGSHDGTGFVTFYKPGHPHVLGHWIKRNYCASDGKYDHETQPCDNEVTWRAMAGDDRGKLPW